MRRPMRAVAGALAAVSLAAGCGVVGIAEADPTWVDKPDLPPAEANPQLPNPPVDPNAPLPGEPGTPGEPGQPGAEDTAVVATKLSLPWGIAILPDGAAIVGERNTGRILRVEPRRSPVRETMRIRGLDVSGEGGLLGLALSPSYSEDRLVYAYVTTATDNRILRFELGGTPQPVFTGIPKGRTGNGGRITFGPDDLLFVGTGDTGRPAEAAKATSLAGKILRLDEFGRPAEDNPAVGSPIYASGFRDVAGLCFDTRDTLFATDLGNGQVDEVNVVEEGKNYGWPAVTGKAGRSGMEDPALTLRAGETTPGGCGAIGFGLFVSALSGAKLWTVPLSGSDRLGTPRALLAGQYGRLRGVEPAPDGALWLTTSNRDGRGRPIPDDDRVIRIVPPTETTTSPA